MNNTKAIKWVNSARPLVAFIEKRGGQKIPSWVSFSEYIGDSHNCIVFYESRNHTILDDEDCVVNNQAVVAAICMWIMDISYDHYNADAGIRELSCILPSISKHGWAWNFTSSGIKRWGNDPSKELAFLALLTAICKSLGYTESPHD